MSVRTTAELLTGDPHSRVCEVIGGAKKSVLIASYLPLSSSLVGWLERLIRDGKKVQVVLNEATCPDENLRAQCGGTRRVTPPVGAMHHKFFVVDGLVVGVGSYNFQGPGHHDSILICRSRALAAELTTTFDDLLAMPHVKILPTVAREEATVLINNYRRRHGNSAFLVNLSKFLARRGYLTGKQARCL